MWHLIGPAFPDFLDISGRDSGVEEACEGGVDSAALSAGFHLSGSSKTLQSLHSSSDETSNSVERYVELLMLHSRETLEAALWLRSGYSLASLSYSLLVTLVGCAVCNALIILTRAARLTPTLQL